MRLIRGDVTRYLECSALRPFTIDSIGLHQFLLALHLAEYRFSSGDMTTNSA